VQYPQGFNTYLESTTDVGGCDRPLNEIQGALRAPPLVGGGDSTPVRLWWLNGYSETGTPMPKGKRFNLRIAVDGAIVASNGLSYSEIFSALVKVSSPGYVRRSTGELDPTTAQSQFPWSGSLTPLTLLADLPPGYAVAWDIVMSFSPDQIGGYLKAGSQIEVDLVEVPEAGLPTPLGAIYGNIILNRSDFFYIVPNRRKKGAAIVGGYQAASEGEQIIVGLAADTPNQKCVINGALNGEIFVRDIVFPTEAVRAIVSTEPGLSKTTAPVSVTLTSAGAIEIIVTHPTAIRNDYLDEVAGVECQVNVPYLRVFVVTSTGILRRNDPIPVGTESTTILISELSVFTPIQTIVSLGDDFCLFAPASVTASAKIPGSISSGTYQILIAYEYPSPNYIITKISHDPSLGCIPVLREADYYYWRAPLSTVAIAKSLPISELIDGSVRLIREKKKLYFYDSLNTEPGDDDNVINVTNGSGSLVALSSGDSSAVDNNTYLTDELGNILTDEQGNLLTFEL
jgi:hypothetical protein